MGTGNAERCRDRDLNTEEGASAPKNADAPSFVIMIPADTLICIYESEDLT